MNVLYWPGWAVYSGPSNQADPNVFLFRGLLSHRVVQPSKAQVDGGATPCVLLLPSPAALSLPSWIPGSSSRVYMAVRRPWPSYHYWLLDASQQARMGAACQSPEPGTLLPSLPGMCSARRPPPLCDNATATASSSTARHVCHAACSRRVHSDASPLARLLGYLPGALDPDTRRLRTTVPPHHARTTYSTRSARSEYNTHSVPNL